MKYFWPWSKTQSHYRRCFTAAGPFAYTLYLFSCFSGATQQRALLFSWHSALSGWTYNYALEIVNPQGVKILLQIETCFMLVQKDLFLCYFLFLCLPHQLECFHTGTQTWPGSFWWTQVWMILNSTMIQTDTITQEQTGGWIFTCVTVWATL